MAPFRPQGLIPVGDPGLDMFIAAMLRAVGGRLVIVPSDGILMENEYVEVYETADPKTVVYELKEREPDEDDGTQIFQGRRYPPKQPRMHQCWTDSDGVTWEFGKDPSGWTTVPGEKWFRRMQHTRAPNLAGLGIRYDPYELPPF